MSGFVYFILGLALSIPVAVLAPLFTPRVQKRLAQTSANRARQRSAELQAGYEQAKRFHEDHSSFNTFLLGRILWILLLTTVATMVAGFFSGLASAFFAVHADYTTGQFLYAASSFVVVLIGIVIIQIAVRTWRVWRRVTNFSEYEEALQAEITALSAVGTS